MTKPKKINWFPSYALHHKIPFGAFVFNEQIQRISETVKLIDRPPFEYLKDNTINGTYIFFNGGINYGREELNALLDWVDKGNTLMVSAVDFEPKLLDTLHLSTESVSTVANFNNEYQVQLVNPHLDNNTFKFDKPTTFFHFNEIDTLNTRIIGFIDTYRGENQPIKDSLVNIIKQSFGDGEIILSTFPQAFTNYFILNSPNQNYTSSLLSYLDTKQPIFIDTYYKSGKKFYTSPMYLFLNNDALKWAYYLVLIGVLIYVIFEGRRKQRAIPIIKPLKNQTIAFTRTIANMYYEKGQHKDIATHKIQHFLDHIRSTMYLQTYFIDDEFITNLAARSNNSIEDTKALFDYINTINSSEQINDKALEKLNTLIENFKSQNTWKTKP
ncbi:DUF4350 domain-containing protein [Winogradskyella sp.]|uniref:DUF4350 domain-containing protein n=1 Tax=Winogradskyella sp. TaxID=1883156 RepID=UPI00260DC02C|nr:DUF4350 domain-containing protein [Winogradskyella sp.]